MGAWVEGVWEQAGRSGRGPQLRLRGQRGPRQAEPTSERKWSSLGAGVVRIAEMSSLRGIERQLREIEGGGFEDDPD